MSDQPASEDIAELLDRAQQWAAQDPDIHTRRELLTLVSAVTSKDATALATLRDSFDGRLQFGTAGLRGALGPGPNRMNRVVVMQAAAGLAAYVNALPTSGGSGRAIVIGYDARHNSDIFARDSAAVFSGAGISALVLPRALPTPVLAYAVRHLGCAAGVMVTASHNPPQDNGYKVYLGNGSQIVPPADTDISNHIERIAALALNTIALGDEWLTLGDDVEDDYVGQVASLISSRAPRQARVVYTPMHGVGGRTFEQTARRAGFPAPIRVDLQFEPDPDFPTVAFPNPEEPGAIDLALEQARASDADVVIANDPDADRCAVAVPIAWQAGASPAGTGSGTGNAIANLAPWRMLTGDEVGALLAWWMIQRRVGHGVFAQSLVSCSILEPIATSAGVAYEQTLTGFKWIARIPDLAYGYEEALGYCVDPVHVGDKDGISAALLVMEMVAALKESGRTLQDVLDDLAVEHGVHATSQVSARVRDLSRITAIMADLRASQLDVIAGIPVVRVDDLENPTDGLPPTDGLRFLLAGGARIIVRPSGTEPKIKCYLQVIEPVGNDGLAAARTLADNRMKALRDSVATWLE
jgi:phosphomannomutase